MPVPRPRTAMRQIREVLRLAQAKNLTPTQIAVAAHLPRTTVRSYLSRAAAAGLSWPLPDDLDDRGLEPVNQSLFWRIGDPIERSGSCWTCDHRADSLQSERSPVRRGVGPG